MALLAVAAMALLSACDPTPNFESDDFSSGYLDPNWSVVDPLRDGSVSFSGLNSANARVELSVPAGTSHQPWATNNSLRLMQTITNADLGIEAKFDSVPSVAYQEQGILVEQDDTNYLRFDLHHDGSNLKAYAAKIVNGSPTSIVNVVIPTGSSLWTRVTRTGNQWSFQTSNNGTTWVSRATFSQALTITQAGVFAGNHTSGGSAPAWTALVDYVFNTAAPISPEDPVGTRYQVTTGVVGEGTVVRYPDLPSYAQGDSVLLIALPDPGWIFESWSGDASGTSQVINPSATSNLDITANFVADPDPDPPDIVSDDFRSGALGSHWTPHDPMGDGSVSFSGVGTSNARMNLAVPAGVNHEPWVPNESLHVMQDVDDEDFGVEVKFDSVPSVAFQEQGVLVQQDDDNYLRFEFHHNGSSLKAYVARIIDGVPTTVANVVVPTGSSVFTRVVRVGDNWNMQTSVNGTTWVSRATFDQALAPSSVGVYAGNYGAGSSAPAWTALVDYVFDVHNPLSPEDPPSPPVQLSTTVVGQGSIQKVPDQTTYAQGQQVDLTAVPAAGWAFAGWSGDVVSTENPLTLTLSADTAVTATFVVQPDGDPPVISEVAVGGLTPSSATISWATDELATSSVSYGPTTAYENGATGSGLFVIDHLVTLTGLSPNTTYHYRVSSTDPSNNTATDVDRTFTTPAISTGGPNINVWYGNNQTFGSPGTAQRWVNVLGRATDPNGVTAMTYRLNGGPPVSMGIGPDGRRLVKPGDFNVDLLVTDLVAGNNLVQIDAVDSVGDLASVDVTVNYQPATVWPLPYLPDLFGATEPNDIGQVVDGRWNVGGGLLSTIDGEIGYDRLIAIGDSSWTDYEATFTMRVNALAAVPGPYSNAPAAGFLLRWSGHNRAGSGQPQDGFTPNGIDPTPFGAYGLWRNTGPGGRLELRNHFSQVQASQGSFDLVFGQTYEVRTRVETDGSSGSSTYRFKLWPQGTSEPAPWNLQFNVAAAVDVPTSGSLVLLAHEADVDFGNLSVTELSSSPASALVDLGVVRTGPPT